MTRFQAIRGIPFPSPGSASLRQILRLSWGMALAATRPGRTSWHHSPHRHWWGNCPGPGPASHDVRLATIWGLIAAGRAKMRILVSEGRPSTTIQLQVSSLVVTFSGIGQPQVIPVPAHAIPTYGLG